MKSFISHLSLILFAFALSFTAYGQGQGYGIDKIAAKIDNYIVLKSDIENAYVNFLASGQPASPDVKCEILKQILIEKVLVAKAEIDSVTVDAADVTAEIEQRMNYFVQEAGSEEILEKRFNKKLADLKEELRPQVHEQLTSRKMRKEITGDIEITPAMVKKFFNRIKDSLPMLPAEYEVAQIMKYPLVSKSEKQVVIEKLNDLKKQILAGADFAALAKIHSEDFSSATQGGGLGFRGRGELVPEFEATAFKLAPNEISEPIESQFGFHLIQLLERRGNRFNARHILIRPSSGDLNFKETKKLLDSIRTLVLTDQMPFEKAAKEFSDDRATKTNGGFFTGQSSKGNRVQAEELDYGAFRVIDTMKVGNISEPFVFRNDEGKEAVRILLYKKKVAAHQADLVADYEKLQQIALNEQKNKHIEKWFLKAINDLYIDIDPEYKDCQLLELAVE